MRQIPHMLAYAYVFPASLLVALFLSLHVPVITFVHVADYIHPPLLQCLCQLLRLNLSVAVPMSVSCLCAYLCLCQRLYLCLCPMINIYVYVYAYIYDQYLCICLCRFQYQCLSSGQGAELFRILAAFIRFETRTSSQNLASR